MRWRQFAHRMWARLVLAFMWLMLVWGTWRALSSAAERDLVWTLFWAAGVWAFSSDLERRWRAKHGQTDRTRDV